MQPELYRKFLLFWQYYKTSLPENVLVFQVSSIKCQCPFVLFAEIAENFKKNAIPYNFYKNVTRGMFTTGYIFCVIYRRNSTIVELPQQHYHRKSTTGNSTIGIPRQVLPQAQYHRKITTATLPQGKYYMKITTAIIPQKFSFIWFLWLDYYNRNCTTGMFSTGITCSTEIPVVKMSEKPHEFCAVNSHGIFCGNYHMTFL